MATFKMCPNCGKQLAPTVRWCNACSARVPCVSAGKWMIAGIVATSIAFLACLDNLTRLLGTDGDPLDQLPFSLTRCAIFGLLILWFSAGLAFRSKGPAWRKARAVRAGFEIALGATAVAFCLRIFGNTSEATSPRWPELTCLWVTGLTLIIIGMRAVLVNGRR